MRQLDNKLKHFSDSWLGFRLAERASDCKSSLKETGDCEQEEDGSGPVLSFSLFLTFEQFLEWIWNNSPGATIAAPEFDC